MAIEEMRSMQIVLICKKDVEVLVVLINVV